MNPESMKPHGAALLDYHRGNHSSTVVVFRDDGLREEMPASMFFRGPLEFDSAT